jgi:hypothetical protein
MIFMGFRAVLMRIALFCCKVFTKKNLFDFVHAINLKNKPCFSVLDDMPTVSAIFPAREVLESKLVL